MVYLQSTPWVKVFKDWGNNNPRYKEFLKISTVLH